MAQAEPEEELFTKRPRINRRAVAEVAKAIDAATWDASTYDQTLRLGQPLPHGPLPRGPALGYCQDFVHIYPDAASCGVNPFSFSVVGPRRGLGAWHALHARASFCVVSSAIITRRAY